MELSIIFPNTKFIQINKGELKKNMKYVTKRNQNQSVYVFMDECKYIGNTFTFLRTKAFILSQNHNNFNYETKIIDEELTLDSSYFNRVEIYKFD